MILAAILPIGSANGLCQSAKELSAPKCSPTVLPPTQTRFTARPLNRLATAPRFALREPYDRGCAHRRRSLDCQQPYTVGRCRYLRNTYPTCPSTRTPLEIALLACDDTRIATLNADFRSKPSATNVLSWPSGPWTPTRLPPDGELGDIAIAYGTCVREAAEQGKALADHTTHLIVHATLHLLGFDHETDAEAGEMEALEVEILARLGLPDPYRGQGT